MEDVMEILLVMGILFIGLPWIIFHYITKWKMQASLTTEDEKLLDELHDLARRLDDRMVTIERIMNAENPNWRQIAADPAGLGIEHQGFVPGQPDYAPERSGYTPVRRVGQ
jgi:phage shock protein B